MYQKHTLSFLTAVLTGIGSLFPYSIAVSQECIDNNKRVPTDIRRGICGSIRDLMFFAFVPKQKKAFTIEKKPSIYWYVSKDVSNIDMKFTIDKTSEWSGIDKTFEWSGKAGIHRLPPRLFTKQPLKVNPEKGGYHPEYENVYNWSLSLVCAPRFPSGNLKVTGSFIPLSVKVEGKDCEEIYKACLGRCYLYEALDEISKCVNNSSISISQFENFLLKHFRLDNKEKSELKKLLEKPLPSIFPE